MRFRNAYVARLCAYRLLQHVEALSHLPLASDEDSRKHGAGPADEECRHPQKTTLECDGGNATKTDAGFKASMDRAEDEKAAANSSTGSGAVGGRGLKHREGEGNHEKAVEKVEVAIDHEQFTQLAKQQPGWAPAYDGATHLASLGPAPDWVQVVAGSFLSFEFNLCSRFVLLAFRMCTCFINRAIQPLSSCCWLALHHASHSCASFFSQLPRSQTLLQSTSGWVRCDRCKQTKSPR